MDKETIEKAKKEWELIQKLGLQDILYKPYCLDGDYNPYVYICKDKDDNVIYVGRSQNIDSRMSSHQDNDYWWNKVNNITVAKLKSKTDMAIYEIYYINKFKPKYNTKDKFEDYDYCTLKLKELKFEKYKKLHNFIDNLDK